MTKLIFLIFLIHSFNVFARTTVDGCQVGEYNQENEEGITRKWSGACIGGKATGKGVLQVFKDGDLIESYEGELKDGRKDGKGVWQVLDSSIRYEGEWNHNEMEGRGVYTDEKGDRYDGEFRHGVRHGNMLIIYSPEDSRRTIFERDEEIMGVSIFTGLWYEDINTGCKIFNTIPSGIETVKWSGTCLNGKANGHGITEWFRNGKLYSHYEGEYFRGKRHGKGSIVWNDNARYEGDWNDDARTGKGIFTWEDGSRYEGNFLVQKLEGFGELIIPRSAYNEKKEPPEYPSYSKQGHWLGDKFVQRGYFANDSLIEVCPSEKNCKSVTDELRIKTAFEKRNQKN